MRLATRKSELDKHALNKEDNYLTNAQLERFKKELDRLKNTERLPAAEEVQRTAQMGDLSENAAYQFAKQHLRRINGRITSLEEKIKHAVIIKKSLTGEVNIGSTVTLETNGQKITYEILGSAESNPARGRISHLSPLGQALLKKTTGQTISLTLNQKTTNYKILSVT